MQTSEEPSHTDILQALEPNHQHPDDQQREENKDTKGDPNLLTVTLTPPATKETSPRVNPNTRVDHAYMAHPLLGQPHLGEVIEDATSLMVRLPPGSTNRPK